MCPLCLRADFLTRLRPACDYRPHSLFIAFETRVRSPATNSFPAPTPVQPVIFELARKRASSLCALCVCAQISRRDFVWLGLQTGLFYFWPFKRGCARPQLSRQRPPCVLATRLLLCARRLVAWRHTCVQLRSPHNRIRTHCSQAHTYAGTGRDDHRDQARRCQDRACQDLGDHAPPSGTRASGGRQSGGRQSGGRQSGRRQSGRRQRAAGDRAADG